MIVQGMYWNVTVQGTGEAIVLLHGWGQNLYMMKFIADHFAKEYQCVNMDLPGFGKSDEPHEVWDIHRYVVGLHEVLAQLGIERAILIAHSFGARIALRYAMRYPVNKMILSGAAGIQDHHGIQYYMRIYTYKMVKRLHIGVRMGSYDYQKATKIMRGVLIESLKDNLESSLSHVACVTLLVWGEKDQQTPLWMGKRMQKEIPNATLIVLRRGDHFAYFHQSMRFIYVVEAFLHG